MRAAITLSFIILAGCAVSTPPVVAPGPTLSPEVAVRNFTEVVRRIEPVAEAECRARTRDVPCDYAIVVDPDVSLGINAFQTEDEFGRPLIVFTIPLIAEARNRDELAFVMGHEAAHHILGHLGETQQNAQVGAILLGTLASVATAGASPEVRETSIETALETGALLGARRYSKENELEADALGALIALRAGYDPLLGAEFFARLPDPGDRFLGSHPPNEDRFDVVRKVVAAPEGI